MTTVKLIGTSITIAFKGIATFLGFKVSTANPTLKGLDDGRNLIGTDTKPDFKVKGKD